MSLTKVKAGNILLTTPAASSNDVTPATTAYVTTALANLADSAPSTLDTLNELAAALGDDANFSTTVTNSIAAKLPLAGGTLTGDTSITKSGNPVFMVKTTGAGNNPVLRLQADTNKWDLQGTFSNTNDELFFMYNSSTKMAINKNGNVGIGQTDPATTLHIGDGASHYVRIENAGSGDISSGYQIYRGSSIGMSLYDNPADNTTSLLCAGSLNINCGGSGADLHVNTNGKIGIGTTSPSSNLHVETSTHANIRIQAGANSSASLRLRNDAVDWDVNCQTNDTFAIYNHTNSTQPFSILPSGDVGIGTASPADYDSNAAGISSNLVVKDSGHSGIIIIAGTSSDAAISFGDGTGAAAYRGAIAYVNSQDKLYFKSAGSNRMVIDSSGSLGLGTINPGSLLHVAHSNAGANPTARIENTTGTVATNSVLLDLKFSGDDAFSNCDYIKFQDSSGEEGVITGDGGGRVYYEINSDYRLKENILNYSGGLDKIKALSVKTYNYKTRPGTTYTGFLAHEVAEVVDGVARGTKDAVNADGTPDYQGMDLSKLVPDLVSAIQELEARITTLEG